MKDFFQNLYQWSLAVDQSFSNAMNTISTAGAYIKNSIAAIADQSGTKAFSFQENEKKNRGGFVMGQSAMDVHNLLSRSQELARRNGKEGK